MARSRWVKDKSIEEMPPKGHVKPAPKAPKRKRGTYGSVTISSRTIPEHSLPLSLSSSSFDRILRILRNDGGDSEGNDRRPPPTANERNGLKEAERADADGASRPSREQYPYGADHDEDEELFYADQLVDHFDGSTDTWDNRYYASSRYYGGPGHPIFMVVGGEGSLEKMLYPFVNEHLAFHFGAAVVQIEHRFYGPYQPLPNATVEELTELLTPQQAMADMVRLTKHFKDELGCGGYDRTSPEYCPVVS
ncbi:hypothetical protein THAOC_30673, partial [Thalassiosira oceanica]